MTSIELASIILAGEFALVAIAVPAFLWRRRSKDTDTEYADAEALFDDIEAKEPSRREALSTIFSSTYQLEGDELEQKVNEFVEREQTFYEVMTQIYLTRDGEKLKTIPEELTKVISPWLRMTPPGEDQKGEITALESANSELNTQLDATREKMDALMREYLAAFKKAEAAEAALSKESDEADDAAVETGAADEGAAAADGDVAPADPVASEDKTQVFEAPPQATQAETSPEAQQSAATDLDETDADELEFAPAEEVEASGAEQPADTADDSAPELAAATAEAAIDVSIDDETMSHDDLDDLFDGSGAVSEPAEVSAAETVAEVDGAQSEEAVIDVSVDQPTTDDEPLSQDDLDKLFDEADKGPDDDTSAAA